MTEREYHKELQEREEYYNRRYETVMQNFEEYMNDVYASCEHLVQECWMKDDTLSLTMTYKEFKEMIISELKDML